MKKFLLFFVFISAMNINAQTAIPAYKAVLQNEVSFPKDKGVDVRLLHPDFDKITEEYLQANPDGLLKNRLNKTSATYTLGSTHTFKSVDLTTSAPYTFFNVPATCQAVGTRCYIFVEDASWNTKVNSAAVTAVQNAFDNSTPANASKGIYETNVGVFGDPPNVDGDLKIIILILDIKDGYTPGNSYTQGYFYSLDQTTNANSNQAEIYYLDCNPLNLLTTSGVEDGMATAAHEFQHMISWNYHNGDTGKPYQTTFFNEGCSMVAERINGYDFREQSSFANDTPQGLLVWRTGTNDVLKDYSRAARFMLYYYEQFGTQFLTKFVQSSYAGITGIDDALSKLSTTTARRFDDILPDWYIANAIDDKSVNTKWGYDLTGMPKPEGSIYWNANVASNSPNVPYMGAQIITHKGSLSLNSVFANCNSTYHSIKAIKFSSGSPVVENVPLNSTYDVPALSGTYTAVQYLIMNSSVSTDYTFQYSSTGTNPSSYEFKYDVGGSVGPLNFSANTKQGVVFNAVSGVKLNSVRGYFRNNANPLSLEIWTYTGSIGSPLGTKLSQTYTVTNSTSDPGWVETILSSENINLNQPIVVVYQMGASVSSGGNTILCGKIAGENFSNSVFSPDGSNSFVWYTVTGESNTWVNIIRAYGEIAVGVEKVIELIPKEFSLQQNYPNPFNPSTKIKFTLPEASKVTIRIYDMLGREVKTLLNAQHNAGNHEVEWRGDDNNGQKVATGIYLYALSTNKLLLTKKMVLLK